MTWNDENNDFGARQRRVSSWTQLQRERMNAAFLAAMQAAGYGLTAPSTVAGTRNPILGYQREN